MSVPARLLSPVERVAALEPSPRSAFICAAVQRYVAERKRREMRRQLRFGYRSMGPLNLVLAEEGPVFEAHRARRHQQVDGP